MNDSDDTKIAALQGMAEREALMTPWASGVPPCPGWWNASMNLDPLCMRYWDGFTWSLAYRYGNDAAEITAALSGRTSEWRAMGIRWRGLRRPFRNPRNPT